MSEHLGLTPAAAQGVTTVADMIGQSAANFGNAGSFTPTEGGASPSAEGASTPGAGGGIGAAIGAAIAAIVGGPE